MMSALRVLKGKMIILIGCVIMTVTRGEEV